MLRKKVLIVVGAMMIASAMFVFAPASAEAQPRFKSCSAHKVSCDSGCARSRTPNHWSCIKGNSCEARFQKCMKKGTWTSLTRNPGTRPAARW